jgi:HEPN domain-containing protein
MPKQPRDLAQLLIRKAQADLRSASLLLGDDDLVDPACFHIQQASEKLLKALLASAGIAYPFTHDLGELLSLALVRFPALAEFSDTRPRAGKGQLRFLTPA